MDTEAIVDFPPIPECFACVAGPEPHKTPQMFPEGRPGISTPLCGTLAQGYWSVFLLHALAHVLPPYIRAFESGMSTLSMLFTAAIEMTCKGSSSSGWILALPITTTQRELLQLIFQRLSPTHAALAATPNIVCRMATIEGQCSTGQGTAWFRAAFRG